MADYDLGTAKGRIEIVYDPSGVKQAQKGLDGLSKSNRNVAADFDKTARVSGAATLVIAGGLALAAKSAIDFEKQVSAIGAVSGATEVELEALRKKALQLGSDTAFSASEAALAMEELAKAGIGVDDILNGAADATVALAAAGGIELPEAATIAANAMNAFSLQAKDLGHVADLIAGAANASAIDVREFGFALQQSGAVANLVGVSFDDLTTAIALMGNAGIKGSDAGTSLKTMLSNLQPATKKQRDLMRELGIVTANGTNQFFNQRGELKSLSEVAQILQDSTAGMTSAQKQMALETIFGSDAIRAAAVLTKAGAKGFDELAASIGKVTAKDVAAKRLDNVAGAIEQLKGSAETAAIAIGSALLPAIKAVTEFITRATNAFSNLDPNVQRVVAILLTAAAAIGGLITIVAKLGAAILGLSGIGAGTLAAFGWVGLIIAAIAALVVGFKLLYDRSAAFRDLVGTIGATVARAFKTALEAVQPFVDFIRTEAVPMITRAAKVFGKNLAPAFEAIGKFIQQHVIPAVDKLKGSLDSAMPTIIKVARFFLQLWTVELAALGKALGFIIPLLLKIAGPIFDGMVAWLSFLIRSIPPVVRFLVSVGKTFVALGGVIADFVQFLISVWDKVSPPILAVFNLIVSIIRLAFTVISAIVSVFMAFLRAAWGVIERIVVPPIEAAFNKIMTVVRFVLGIVQGLIRAAFDFIRDHIGSRMEEGQSIIQKVWDAIQAIWQKAVDAVVAVTNGIRKVVEKVTEFFSQLKAAADKGVGPLLQFVGQIPAKIISALGNIARLLYDKGRDLVQGFIDGIKSMASKLADTGKNLIGGITRFFPGSPAKEGPLSGKGYVLYRGQHLAEDFALGIARQADEVQRAVMDLVSGMVGDMGVDRSVAVNGALAGAALAPVSATALNQTAQQQASRVLNVGTIELKGVWDFTDPTVARKVVAELHGALDAYEKEYA